MKKELTPRSFSLSCLNADNATPCVVELSSDSPCAVSFILHPDSKIRDEKDFLLLALGRLNEAAMCCVERLMEMSPRFESEDYLTSATLAAENRYNKANSAQIEKMHLILSASI